MIGVLTPPVYSFAECGLLFALQPSPDELRAIHLVKTLLQGDLVSSLGPDHVRRLYTRLLEEYYKAARSFDTRAEDASEADVLHLTRQLSHLLNHMERHEAQNRDLPRTDSAEGQ